MLEEATSKQIFNARKSQPEAAQFAGVKSKDIQNWIARDLIVGHRGKTSEIEGGGIKGKRRSFTYYSVMQFAIMGKLHDFGVERQIAAKAAADFSHAGGGGKTLQLPERYPGMPFHYSHGVTIFALGDNGRTFEAILGPAFECPFRFLSYHLQTKNMVTIEINPIFDSICQKMGLEPRDILDWTYKSQPENGSDPVRGD